MLLRLDSGRTIDLAPDDARLLVGALWAVAAATRGAVVAIGKLEHCLKDPSVPVVELAAAESGALDVALADGAGTAPGLARLRAAIFP